MGIIEETADFTDLNEAEYGVQGNDFGITNVDPLTNGLGDLQVYYDALMFRISSISFILIRMILVVLLLFVALTIS